jgi:hypothetical protein
VIFGEHGSDVIGFEPVRVPVTVEVGPGPWPDVAAVVLSPFVVLSCWVPRRHCRSFVVVVGVSESVLLVLVLAWVIVVARLSRPLTVAY